MRVLRSHGPGGPETLMFESVDAPTPGKGELLIRVVACALNYPDALLLRGLYQVEAPRPFIPGSEVAGIVERVGADVVAFEPGDRVAAVMAWGGLAELVVVAERDCFAMGDDIPFDEAAAMPVAHGTSHLALSEAEVTASDSVIVLGASGGVGIAAIQLARARGAHVIAAASSADKVQFAIANGANASVVYPTLLEGADAARAFTSAIRACCPKGAADVVVDMVGGAYSEPAFRSLGWGGRHLVIGFTAGIPRLPLNLPLLKGARIIGINYGGFVERAPDERRRQMEQLGSLHAAGVIRPCITRRYAFDAAAEAMGALEGRSVTGKIVVEMHSI